NNTVRQREPPDACGEQKHITLFIPLGRRNQRGVRNWRAARRALADAHKPCLRNNLQYPTPAHGSPHGPGKNKKTRRCRDSHTYASVTLTAQAQLGNNRTVAVGVLLAQIGKHPPTLTDQLEQATAGTLVVLVLAEMFLQLTDAPVPDSYLDLRRSGIALELGKLLNQLGFFFRCQTHHTSSIRY